MPDVLSQTDINVAYDLHADGNLDGMYTYLSDKGYTYADLASGVVNGDTLAGKVALEFMSQSAEDQGNSLTNGDIDIIRADMAFEYLNTLDNQISLTGSISSDITSQEAHALPYQFQKAPGHYLLNHLDLGQALTVRHHLKPSSFVPQSHYYQNQKKRHPQYPLFQLHWMIL